MIAVITDSSAQMPPDLAARYSIGVIPVVVTIDGVDFEEGVDLTPDDFWALCVGDQLPEVTTSQPSPGVIAQHYRAAAERGATEIVSVHVGTEHSGTVNAARIASEMVDIPIRLVDTGTASFGVTCCAWEVAAAIEAGATAAEAAARGEATAELVGTTFIIQALDFARAGGRFNDKLPEGHDGVMVLGGVGGAIDVLGSAHTVDELCDQMVAPWIADGRPIRAGVALADPGTLVFTEGIEARLRDADIEVDVVRYRIGPSIAAHTGPGTAGGFWYPIG